MRILYVTVWHPEPPDNGYKLRVYHLLRAMAARHTVTLLTFTSGDPVNIAAKRRKFSDAFQVRTIPLDPFVATQRPALRRFFSSQPAATLSHAPMQKAVAETLQQDHLDAVIVSTFVNATYVQHAAPSSARILEEHNSLTRWMEERYYRQQGAIQRLRCWLTWQRTRHYEAHAYADFDLITAVSQEDAKTLRNMLPSRRDRIAVIPNGVDTAHNKPDFCTRTPYTLVYNGALTYRANYDAMRYFLAEIYPHIRQSIPEVTLTITGSIAGVDLAGLALDPSVKLTGYVTDVRLPVAQATLCIVPLREGGGTRLKILEAMALGTPVVTTVKGAEGLAVVDREHLRMADDSTTFAQVTIELLHQPAQRVTLANAARKLVEQRYDWVAIGAQFVDLVEAAVARRRTEYPESMARG